jgi:hypothetical protein
LSFGLKTELLMAVKDYDPKRLKERQTGLDITASDDASDERILLRVVSKPKLKSGWVGVDTVDDMIVALEEDAYDKGVLIGQRFTKAAKRKLREEGIQFVSNKLRPNFGLKKLYFVAKDLVDELCKAKCGKTPRKASDCTGYSNGAYSCKTRLISDNASFHFERGWKNLLQQDVLRLLAMHRAIND